MFWINPNLSSVVKYVKPQCKKNNIRINYQRGSYATRAKVEGKNTKLEMGKIRGTFMQSAPVQSLLLKSLLGNFFLFFFLSPASRSRYLLVVKF